MALSDSRRVSRIGLGACMVAAPLLFTLSDFFDRVTVNADDPSFRENRLKLLNRIRAATREVADFSRIEG